jgi:hypothetical protein
MHGKSGPARCHSSQSVLLLFSGRRRLSGKEILRVLGRAQPFTPAPSPSARAWRDRGAAHPADGGERARGAACGAATAGINTVRGSLAFRWCLAATPRRALSPNAFGMILRRRRASTKRRSGKAGYRADVLAAIVGDNACRKLARDNPARRLIGRLRADLELRPDVTQIPFLPSASRCRGSVSRRPDRTSRSRPAPERPHHHASVTQARSCSCSFRIDNEKEFRAPRLLPVAIDQRPTHDGSPAGQSARPKKETPKMAPGDTGLEFHFLRPIPHTETGHLPRCRPAP